MERVQRMNSRGGGSGGGGGGGGTMFADNNNSYSRPKFGTLLYSDPGFSSTSTTGFSSTSTEDDYSNRNSSVSVMSADSSPYSMSPWNQTSPYSKSPWQRNSPVTPLYEEDTPPNCLIGSLVRQEGHIYSLAACDDLLYTGSDSKNIRVWKKQKEFSGFKSTSGLVKAIVISGEKIFTGHQDGKIRIWKVSNKLPNVHKRIGSLPKFKDFVKKSMKPSNYVEVSRKKNALWIKHFDAISCLSLNEDQGLLYSGSWDKTLKVWRIADSKCLESINAHDDAVNSVVSGFDGLVFTGSADGTVKVWRRELQGKKTKHLWLQTLLKQECAVTALAVNPSGTVVYSGSSDGVVNFWEREMHLKHGGELRGHKQAVLCLATAGDLVFTGSADKTICVWRRERTGLHINVSILTGHSGPVKCLAVGKEYGEDDDLSKRSDGRGKGAWILYSGSLDKSVKVWKVSEKSPDIQKLASLKQPKDELLDTPDEDLSPTEQHPPLMFRKW